MTERDPLRVEIEHRGRRRRLDIVLRAEGLPLTHEGRRLGHLVGDVAIHMELPGGHEPTDRFIEEMAEDLGPAEGDDR